jgi:hypothetical protein
MVTLIGNFLLLFILPRNLQNFWIGIIIVSFFLRYAVISLPKFFFKGHLMYMNENQEREIQKILINTGSASIFFSLCILNISGEVSGILLGEEHALVEVVVSSIIILGMFVYGLFREKQSLDIIRELSISLVNSGWKRRYTAST